MGNVLVYKHLGMAVTVVVVDGGERSVDRELLEVGTVVSAELGIKVREKTSLQQGVLAEVNAANDVAWLELHGYVSSRFSESE